MKIGTITFHGAYNYGSVLQAYALKQFLELLSFDCKKNIEYSVINYRPIIQKKIYFQDIFFTDFKSLVKLFMRLPYKKKLDAKADKFERFLHKYLNLTKEYNYSEELVELNNKFDYYIAGSDQIFNIRCKDFSFVNLLDFTESNNKISYAASLGPLDIDWSKFDKQKYVELLKKFKKISVRETSSKTIIDSLLGNDKCVSNVDPTLLLTASQWRQIQSNYKYREGNYILFYCLEANSEYIKSVNNIGKKLHIPIIYTGYHCKYDYFNPFEKQYDVGPEDFLSLVDNAKLIITTSFHGTVFSIIYGKPFWVINGMQDKRISSLLSKIGLECNSLTCKELSELDDLFSCKFLDYAQTDFYKEELGRSVEFFKSGFGWI